MAHSIEAPGFHLVHPEAGNRVPVTWTRRYVIPIVTMTLSRAIIERFYVLADRSPATIPGGTPEPIFSLIARKTRNERAQGRNDFEHGAGFA